MKKKHIDNPLNSELLIYQNNKYQKLKKNIEEKSRIIENNNNISFLKMKKNT